MKNNRIPYLGAFPFLAFTTAAVLSPANTIPITHQTKVLTMAASMISLLIILLAARTVNII